MAKTITAPGRGWLLGPFSDLFFGMGLAYVLVFIWLALDIEGAQQAMPMWILAIITIFISIPHYGATLLRVYEKRSDRSAYFVFAVYLTIVLIVLFFVGLYSAAFGSLLFTVYLTWSPWHYTGQNYGIALMFLYRNGVTVSLSIKRLMYVSFLLSFLVTFVFIHGGYAENDLAPGEIGFVVLGVPALGVDFFIFVGFLAYAIVTIYFLISLLKQSSFLAVLPAILLVSVQALWFILPAIYRNWFPYGDIDSLSSKDAAYFFIWIAFGHAVQYLWITSYYAKASQQPYSHATFYLKVLLVGALLWTVPTFLFRRGMMGPLPYDAGLAMMVAAVVNLHHFILDGAIWKLRDGRIARALLRSSNKTVSSNKAGPAFSSWRWMIVGGVGFVCIVISVFGIWEGHQTIRAITERDFMRAQIGVDRLTWIGRESAKLRVSLGVAEALNGKREDGEVQIYRSLEFYPTASAWLALGEIRTRNGEWERVVEAYQTALQLRPDSVNLKRLLGEAWVELGELDRAQEILQDALLEAPGDRRLEKVLNHVTELQLGSVEP